MQDAGNKMRRKLEKTGETGFSFLFWYAVDGLLSGRDYDSNCWCYGGRGGCDIQLLVRAI